RSRGRRRSRTATRARYQDGECPERQNRHAERDQSSHSALLVVATTFGPSVRMYIRKTTDFQGFDAPVDNGKVQGTVLTKREREVAAFVAEGLTNRDIADRLVISDRTVESHVEHIRNKLGVRSRAQVATWTVTVGEVDMRKDMVLAGPFNALAAVPAARGSEHRV